MSTLPMQGGKGCPIKLSYALMNQNQALQNQKYCRGCGDYLEKCKTRLLV